MTVRIHCSYCTNYSNFLMNEIILCILAIKNRSCMISWLSLSLLAMPSMPAYFKYAKFPAYSTHPKFVFLCVRYYFIGVRIFYTYTNAYRLFHEMDVYIYIYIYIYIYNILLYV